jgi:hypothetical protein
MLLHHPRTLLIAAGVAALLAGCGSDEKTPTAPRSNSQTSSRLEGTWKTGPISPRDVDATLRRYDLAKWTRRFRPISPIPTTTILLLHLKDGKWDLYGRPTTGPRQEIDYNATYVVKGDEVEKMHATGTTTYRWSVNGKTLTFEWLRSTEPPTKGIPDEVFSRALYMTQPFARQP